MKKVLFALLATFATLPSTGAQADTLLIQETLGRPRFKDAQFRFDKAQGKAWVQVHYVERLPSSAPHRPYDRHTYHPTSVPGLWFDAAANRILFNNKAGQKVVCANVTEKSGVFGKKWVITLTGECRTYAIRQGGKTSVYFESN